MTYEICKAICFLILKLFFKLEVKGREVFPRHKPFILASNHVSFLDPVAVGVGCPYALFYLAKEELFRNKLFGSLLKNLNVIPLKRSATDFRALRSALTILRNKPLAIFPQGRRAHGYDDFKAGVGFLHKKTDAPIIAAKVYGTEKALPRGAKSFKREKIKVIFEKVTDIGQSDSYEEIAAKVVTKIKSL
jgi:1-acyl-sn-glycerol-3-phosphate acyltransferase